MKTIAIQSVGAQIREERIARGMTQKELGARIGVQKAQISKIESGQVLTIKTLTKVLDALGLSAGISIIDNRTTDKKVVGYIVAAISEFAKAHSLSLREASNYLMRYNGLEFLTAHYEAEHLLSFEDSITDLTRVCLNNGGGIR